MKRYQSIVAAACLLVGAAGFTGIYMSEQSQQQEEQAKNETIVEESEEIILGSNLENLESKEEYLEPQISTGEVADNDLEADIEGEGVLEDENSLADADLDEEDAAVGTITEEAIHFDAANGVVWPTEGSVLLDYSMDSTIYFPTLQQYQYNSAMVLSAEINDKVYFVARGKITNIETNEETGLTVTQDIGDGYTAIYGQLKELNFEVGDMVESGQVVGYVSEPTKYYSVEGTNVYFQLLKDGQPVDPEEILP